MKTVIILILLLAVKFVLSQKNWTKEVYVPNICVCGTATNCEIASTGGIADGSGGINPRIVATGDTNYYSGSLTESCQPVSTGLPIAASNQSSCSKGLDRCCQPLGYSCGLRYPPVANAPKPTLGSGQADYGGYPWHAIINGPNNTFIASGVLIDQKHVLTVAHRIYNLNMTTVEVRLGVYNRFSNSSDPFPTLIYNATYVIHPSFTAKNLKYNVAILTLSGSVPLGKYPTVANVCMPNTTLSNITCWVSGFGFPDQFTQTMVKTISEIDVPLVDTATCQRQLIATKLLGQDFILDPKHFICAGGQLQKDACFGDGGSPLVCHVYDRFYLAGLVAWGLGCGNFSVPGVYVNVQSFIPWIQQTIIAETPTTKAKPTTTPGIGNTTISTVAATRVNSTKSTTPKPTIKAAVKFTTKKSTTTKKSKNSV